MLRFCFYFPKLNLTWLLKFLSVLSRTCRVVFSFYKIAPAAQQQKQNSVSTARAGTMHGYEVEFVFGIPLQANSKYTESEKKLSLQMMKMWANFAKHG